MSIGDLKYWDTFRDPLWVLHNLLRKRKVLRVLTNAAWATSNAGSGGHTFAPTFIAAYTGATANSRGMVYSRVFGLNSGDISPYRVDWTKDLELRFNVVRLNSDSEAVARVQIKEATSEGALAQRGIGIEINNFDMLGEGYGTVRGTVSIGTLTNNSLTRIRIVKRDDHIEFWVNDVMQGVLTGTAVPNVTGTVDAYIVISVINGPTGGVNAILFVHDIWIIQKW